MSSLKRSLLFILLCIPSRIGLAFLPNYLSDKNKKYYSYLILVISLGFLYLYFSNRRLNAVEGGGVTWWHNYRLIHGMLYLTSFIYLYQNNKYSQLPLLIDILFSSLLYLFSVKMKF